MSHCLSEGKALNDLTLDEFKGFSPAFGDDVYEALAPETCVRLRDIPGGPAPAQVRAAIEAGRAALAEY